jgi:hypothetical protein
MIANCPHASAIAFNSEYIPVVLYRILASAYFVYAWCHVALVCVYSLGIDILPQKSTMQQKQSTYIFIVIAQSIGKTYCPFVPRETV